MEPFPEQGTSGWPDSTESVEPSRRLRRTITLCCWLYLLIVIAAWIMLYAGDLWWPATFLLFSPRWLLAIPLVPLAIAAGLWRRRSLIAVVLASLLVLGPIMGFQVPWRNMTASVPPGKRFRVMTCNMHAQKPLRPDLERLLAEANPDIVAVQEWTQEPFDFFSGEQWHTHREGGLFLASRYPIRQDVRLGDDSMKPPGKLRRYELETPAGVVTLFSLHFASPRKSLNETTEDPETGFMDLVENSDVRWEQSQDLVRLMDREKGPLLVVGDFNTPTESAIFRRVWDRYTDSFTTAGWGWGYTFFGKRTTVRIDHILAGPGWYCERCWVGPYVGSHHHPLLADLILSQP